MCSPRFFVLINDLFTESARGNSNTPLRHSLSFAVGSSTAADFRRFF
jgi:hypothetical protein